MTQKNDTAEYSSTKAPETRPAAEQREERQDATLIPGGPLGSPTAQGMAGLDRDDQVGGGEQEPKQTSYGDTGRPETK
jgi:hypothetical protein